MNTKNNRIPVDLVAGRLRGGNSKLENSLLERWLAREGNAALYEDIEKLWCDIKARAGEDSFDENAAWKEILSSIKSHETARSIHSLRLRLALASTTAAIALAALVIVFTVALTGTSSGIEASQPTEFSSFSGKSAVTLPDGSTVTLYPYSRISCNCDFNIDERNTSLTGRAYYSIAHDPQKPFHIDVDGLRVRVVGTAFDLDSRSDKVILNVTDGTVGLESESLAETILVEKGNRAVFSKEDGSVCIEPADVERAAVWASGRITFNKDDIGTVCRGLSDWYGINIIPSDRISGRGALSFTVTDEPVDVILSIISGTNGISYRHEGNNTIIIY